MKANRVGPAFLLQPRDSLQKESGHALERSFDFFIIFFFLLKSYISLLIVHYIPSLAGHCVSSSSKTPKWPRRWPLPVRTAGQQTRRLLLRFRPCISTIFPRPNETRRTRRRADAVRKSGESVSRQFKSRQQKRKESERE